MHLRIKKLEVDILLMYPKQNPPQGFHYNPQSVGHYSSPQAVFFENLLEGGGCDTTVNICCLSLTFIIFVRSSLTPHNCLHISWDGKDLFENLWIYGFISTNYTREKCVSTTVIREFQKHKVCHVTTFLLNLPYCYFLNVCFH